MFSKKREPSQQKPSELSPIVDKLYDSGAVILNRYLQTLETEYTLTLKDSHNPLMMKCQAVRNDLDALLMDRNICTPEFRVKIESALSEIESDLDMIPLKIKENSPFEYITFANSNVFPASYMSLVQSIDGSIHQVIKVFEDYKSPKARVFHPKRHHKAEAKKITDYLEFLLKKQEWSVEQKVMEARNFIYKVKNGMLGTLEIKIESANPTHLSSFLKRMHYALDKLLVTLPAVQMQEEKHYKPSRRLH